MEKKMVIVLGMILLLISANMETVESQVDCYDACNTACVGLAPRPYLRCDRKCHIRCGPDRKQPKQDVEDRWRWKSSKDDKYTVANAYQLQTEGNGVENKRKKKEFKLVWNNFAIPKAKTLAWKLVWNRVPTTPALKKRKILPPQAADLCTWCKNSEETAKHLFFGCELIYKVWAKCLAWWRVETALH